jgi:hypothetical protein
LVAFVVALAAACILLGREGDVRFFICFFIYHEQYFEESDVIHVLIYEELFPLKKSNNNNNNKCYFINRVRRSFSNPI